MFSRKNCKSLIVLSLFSTTMHAAPMDKISINGYFELEYEQALTNAPIKADPNGSFDSDLFDLVINIQATNRLRVATDITWEHGASTENERGNVAIEYAFAEYTFYNLLKAKVGKMFTPFGIYNELHTAKPATLQVKEPRSTNKPGKLTKGLESTRYFPRWSTGIGIVGDNGFVDYALLLSNGDQEEIDGETNPYAQDNNTEKAVTARVRVTPVDDVRLGISMHYDHQTGQSKEDAPDEDFYNIDTSFDILSASAQLNLELDNFILEFESVYGSVVYKDKTDSSKDEDISRLGTEILVSYYVTENLRPYLQFEYFEPNFDIVNDQIQITTGGVNYELASNLFIKAEVNYIDSAKNNTLYKGYSEAEFKSSISIGF